MYRQLITGIAGLLCLASCSIREYAEDSRPPARICLRIEDSWASPDVKSAITSSDIETNVSSIVIAIYSRGNLFSVDCYPGMTALENAGLKLRSSETYHLYALCNMPGIAQRIPSAESGMKSLEYEIPSLDSVNSGGIPMSGDAEYSGEDEGITIPVKRLFAKVTANLECMWGAYIASVRIAGMNTVCKPFGTARKTTSASLADLTLAAQNTARQSFVFYVPENMQGTIPGTGSPEGKSPDNNAAVASKQDLLTYLDVSVSCPQGYIYEGSMQYRSYLGANSTDNYDIRRNCSYTWDICYYEDMLSREEWKYDSTDLSDLRTISASSPNFIQAGAVIRLSDHVTSNMDPGTVGYSMIDYDVPSQLYGHSAAVSEYFNTENIEGDTFLTDSRFHAYEYAPLRICLSPLRNPNRQLTKYVTYYVASPALMYMNPTLTKDSGGIYNQGTGMYEPPGSTAGLYFVVPGRSKGADVDFSWDYCDDLFRHATTHMTGCGGKDWECGDIPYSGIVAQIMEDQGRSYDQVMYSVAGTVIPGNYDIRVKRKEEAAGEYRNDLAYLHVHDTRTIKWTDRSSVLPSGVITVYRYLSEKKIFLGIKSGVSPGFTAANTPFSFLASDRSGTAAAINGGYTGNPFEGDILDASNYGSHLDVDFSSAVSGTPQVSANTRDGKTVSGSLNLVPTISGSLQSGQVYTLSISAKNAFLQENKHKIEATVLCGDKGVHEFVITPAVTKLSVGATLAFTPTHYFLVVGNGAFIPGSSSTEVLGASDSRLGWSDNAPGGVFTAAEPGNFTVSCSYSTGTATIWAYADIEVLSNDIDVDWNWENSSPVTLE